MGLIVLNYWHALRCESADEHDESEYYVKALEKRLAMAEYESSLNDQLASRLISALSIRPIALDPLEIKNIFDLAEREAVHDTLKMQDILPLPFPNINMGNENGNEEGEILDDDALGGKDKDKSSWFQGWLEGERTAEEEKEEEAKNENTDKLIGNERDDYYGILEEEEKAKSKDGESLTENESIDMQMDDATTLTDGEKTKNCARWLLEYDVIMGKSWGSMPSSMKHKWVSYHCDYHLQKERYGGGDAKDTGPTHAPTRIDLLR